MARRHDGTDQSGSVPAKLSIVVGENLRRLRRKHGLSLDHLARISGVSRAMLGQIETGKSAPTINLLARIAEALKVSVPCLIANPVARDTIFVPRGATMVLASSGGSFSRRAISLEDGPQDIEIFEVTIAPQHRERIGPEAAGAKKRIVVVSGELELIVGEDEPLHLSEGDAVFFNADIAHCIRNPGETEAKAFLVLSRIGDDTCS